MDAPTKHNSLVTMPFRKTKVDSIGHILHLPDRKRIIIYSWGGTFRVWDLETGTQVGEEWEDKDFRVDTIVLSPDGKKIGTGSFDGVVKLWNVDTGKVIKTWTGHTNRVRSVSWSLDGGKVVSGSYDGTFRVWDVESGKSILGPINAGECIYDMGAVCYSPDAKMIATGIRRNGLKIWDANSGVLLKTFKGVFGVCLAWTSDGKTLFAGGIGITKFDTATWTVLDSIWPKTLITTISLSPNERILASTSSKTARLWNLDTNQPIGTVLHHEDYLKSATFSADGKFLVICCRDDHIYTWDVSAIVKRAGLQSDIADVTPRPVPKMKDGRRVPPGFFDDALREANSRIRLSQSHAPPTPRLHQRTLSPFTPIWRRSKPRGATEPATQSLSRPFSWTRNLSGILRRRNRSDIQLREVQVPCTAGQPRNYHARKKLATSSSRPSNSHTTQQHSTATQNTQSSSQLPPPTAAASTLSAVVGTPGTMGAPSRPHNTIAEWRARFVRWLCCAPIQHTDGQH